METAEMVERPGREGGGHPGTRQPGAILLVPIVLVILLQLLHIALRGLYPPGHPLRLLATAALVVAVGAVVVAVAWSVGHRDEYQRQIQLFALAIAFPSSLVVTFAAGFLAAEGLFPGLDPRDLPALLLVTYLVGLAAAWRRYIPSSREG